jgi:histidinol-phosphate phosphatase family protein
VINHTVMRRGAPRAPQDLTEWAWVDGVHDTLRMLHARGYRLFVCTNQPDVKRGWQTREQVEIFHELILRELPIERVYACFHDDADCCSCRKPKPGMLLSAVAEFGLDRRIRSCWVIAKVTSKRGVLRAVAPSTCSTRAIPSPRAPRTAIFARSPSCSPSCVDLGESRRRTRDVRRGMLAPERARL